MQYSPKLKRVAAQIKKILNDNDIAGFVALHTPGHGEFIMEITPSYSCAEPTPLHDGVIIKGKAEHYGGDKDKRDKKLAATINMFNLLSTITAQGSLQLLSVSEQADKTWNAEHTDGGFTSHEQQNN